MKKILSIAVLLLIVIGMSVIAAGATLDNYDYTQFIPDKRVYSTGEYLTSNDIDTFNVKAKELEETYGVTVAFVIMNDFEGSVEEFSDYLYLRSPLGKSYNESMILMSVNMSGRKVDLFTDGQGQSAISDNAVNRILYDIAVPSLKAEDYLGLLGDYFTATEEYLEYYQKKGDAFSESTAPGSNPFPIGIILAFFGIGGLIVAVVFMAVKYSAHRPVAVAKNANDYFDQGSFVLNDSQDVFLRTVTTKTAIPKDTSSGNGGSSHSHSSGNSHGGGSAGF